MRTAAAQLQTFASECNDADMRPLTLPLMSAFSLCACKATTEQPIRTEKIPVSVSVNELVCHVRGVAAEQGLSFHYGTFTDATGPKATFRMVDSSLELELAKWGGGRAYELRAYDMSKSDGANRNANRAFDRFKTALIDGLKHKCAI